MSIWQSIPVDEALDMLQFWVDANWPMTEREAAELSSGIAWTQDQDGWVSNDRFGLSFPDVEGIGPADDPVKRIMLTLTDHEKHITDDFARFIADRFAEYVDGTSLNPRSTCGRRTRSGPRERAAGGTGLGGVHDTTAACHS
ncbi:DUF6301 family protein [Microbacterium sp. OR16]|uniref:DUF6301 family protein n=2 Tax=unclassified Microbacterium TaxID=2609290 RepID=UPI0039B48A63